MFHSRFETIAKCFVFGVWCSCSASIAQAELSLHVLFCDHAVLQQKQSVPVWGAADSGTKVTVEFAGQSKTATAASDGKWMLRLDPMDANAVGQRMRVVSGDEEVEIQDLLIGEVWVCSGQSNMAAALRNSTDYAAIEKEIAAGGQYETLRLAKVAIGGADERQDTANVQWSLVDSQTASGFSATAFYFGRALIRDRNVPVGLIQSAHGGTNAHSWINSDTYQHDDVAGPSRQFWETAVSRGPASLVRYEKQRDDWAKKVAKARKAKRKVDGRAPREPLHAKHVKRPAGHYNAMIAPLQPYAIAGAIWYQGEANSRPPFCDQYKDLMLALVEDWRADWHTAANLGPETPRDDFPFYLVQLPNYAKGHEKGWPMIREQMLKFWQDGIQTGMVTTIDVGDPQDIHPPNKRPVGERLAIFARSEAYGESIECSGPIFLSAEFVGDTGTIVFDHLGGGLVSFDDQPLRHFQVAGEDQRFYEATAKIQGDRVIVSSPQVAKVKAVRYAWSNNPENPNFGSRSKLVASPFRSDDFKIDLE